MTGSQELGKWMRDIVIPMKNGVHALRLQAAGQPVEIPGYFSEYVPKVGLQS